MIHDCELSAALQAMHSYYRDYADYHRLYRWMRAANDELRTELALARQQRDCLADRVSILEETLSEVRFGTMKYPV